PILVLLHPASEKYRFMFPAVQENIIGENLVVMTEGNVLQNHPIQLLLYQMIVLTEEMVMEMEVILEQETVIADYPEEVPEMETIPTQLFLTILIIPKIRITPKILKQILEM